MLGVDPEGGEVQLELGLVEGTEVSRSEGDKFGFEVGVEGADGFQEGEVFDLLPFCGLWEWGVAGVRAAYELEQVDRLGVSVPGQTIGSPGSELWGDLEWSGCHFLLQLDFEGGVFL